MSFPRPEPANPTEPSSASSATRIVAQLEARMKRMERHILDLRKLSTQIRGERDPRRPHETSAG